MPELDAAATWRMRAMHTLADLGYPGEAVPAGFWSVSKDVWEALQRDLALDRRPRADVYLGDDPTPIGKAETGVPTLLGRPLMSCDNGPTCCEDLLIFVLRKVAPLGVQNG